MSAPATTVRRLRWRGPLAQPLAERRRLEEALEDGPAQAGLPPEAILCVRKITITHTRVRHLAGAVARAASGAARPAREPVPAAANAVLFADRAEMLACLARDWCDGGASSWWWPVLFPREQLATTVRRVWLAEAPHVPAALARLAAAGTAGSFLARLTPDHLTELWHACVRTFELAALAAAWSRPLATVDDPPRGAPGPWWPWVQTERSLTPAATRLLVSALLLARAPGVARSDSFARAIRVWNQATEQREEPAASPPARAANDSPAPPAPPPAAEPFEHAVSRAPIRLHETESAPAAAAPISEPERVPPAPLPSTLGSSVERQSELPTAMPLDRLETAWGGVFYLVNVALALGWYGDFTTPANPGLALPLWDFLALAGEGMLGEVFQRDPVASLLARLAGRAPGEPPGAHFVPPDGEPLARWVDRICEALRTRLAAALGLVEPMALVLRHRAMIEATAARVDVRFALATHPIELRMAGLDRDPGWVPAGGRSMAFHYE